MNNFPPILPKDEQLFETFGDSLREIIPGKLQEIMEEQDELVEERTQNLQVLNSWKFKNSFDKWFCYTAFSYDFMEYDILNRHLKYWLRLASKTSKNKEWEKPPDGQPISQEQLIIARESPIEELFPTQLRKVGERLRGRCPFHTEHTGSFFIFLNDNKFYCFGCHERGDVIDFYMKLHEVGFVEAVKALL